MSECDPPVIDQVKALIKLWYSRSSMIITFGTEATDAYRRCADELAVVVNAAAPASRVDPKEK